jgi:hypothetical protein
MCALAAAALSFSDAASTLDTPLQDLARFIAKNYRLDRAPVNREISYTAPLSGDETTFLHFTWKVTTTDQYGQGQRDELFGMVKYSPLGDLEQLVVGGPLVDSNHLRDLRRAIKAGRRWPKQHRSTPFGPNTSPDQIGLSAAQAIGQLLKTTAHVKAVRFNVMNSVGEPDGTWHIDLHAWDRGGNTVVTARVEPFTGKIIQVDVCREDC